jgi:hypothetical protein
MKITRTNALTKAPGMPGYTIPLKAGTPNQLLTPVPDISLKDPDDELPANTVEPGLSFSICGRRLTRLPPRIETRCVAGHPGNTGTVIPEVV